MSQIIQNEVTCYFWTVQHCSKTAEFPIVECDSVYKGFNKDVELKGWSVTQNPTACSENTLFTFSSWHYSAVFFSMCFLVNEKYLPSKRAKSFLTTETFSLQLLKNYESFFHFQPLHFRLEQLTAHGSRETWIGTSAIKSKIKKSVLPQNEDGPSTYSRFELVDSRFWSPHRKKFSLGSIRYYWFVHYHLSWWNLSWNYGIQCSSTHSLLG